MLSTLTLVVARSILLVVMIFSAVLTVLWTSVYICALFSLSVSRTSFNISPFPVNLCYFAYNASLMESFSVELIIAGSFYRGLQSVCAVADR